MNEPIFKDYRNFVGSREGKFYKTTLFQSDRLMLGLNCLEPGQTQHVHDHADQDKFYHVLEGVGLFTVGDDVQFAGTRHHHLGRRRHPPRRHQPGQRAVDPSHGHGPLAQFVTSPLPGSSRSHQGVRTPRVDSLTHLAEFAPPGATRIGQKLLSQPGP